jgi:cytidylate kinase
MSIIIISSDDRETEAIIAEKVAGEKGYDRLDRRFLTDIAAGHQVNTGRLQDALEALPSLLKKMPARQWRQYLAWIEAAVLERMLADNVVCSGLAAHLYVTGISHAMKIRILSGKSQKTADMAEQNAITPEKAEKWVAKELALRKKWSLAAFNSDETDLSRYDMVISLDQIDPVEAVRTITGASEYRKFQVMTYSMKCLTDLALAARVKTVLLKEMTDVNVQVRDGAVVVSTRSPGRQKKKKVDTIKALAGSVNGVSYVEVHVKNRILKANG